MKTLRTSDISKTYRGRKVVDNVSLWVEQGEVVGVFSGYDWAKDLAVISPGKRAQKLIEEYASATKP